ncbi:hypothetical protein ACFX2F_006053 [Malus domestica]
MAEEQWRVFIFCSRWWWRRLAVEAIETDGNNNVRERKPLSLHVTLPFTAKIKHQNTLVAPVRRALLATVQCPHPSLFLSASATRLSLSIFALPNVRPSSVNHVSGILTKSLTQSGQ